MSDASIVPEDLDYVNAHGTGTALNDRAETEALKQSLGPWSRHVPVSSAKSAIGHTLGAAGAVEAVVTLLALRAGIAPPTLNFGEREEGLDLDYVGDGPHALPDQANGARYGLTNSLGFGGHNTVLVIESGGKGR
jgi:3-oxoacyl-[acyl-carrier-protein] synthase II